MAMTQQWFRLAKEYKSKLKKLQSKYGAAHTYVNLHVMDSVAVQPEDPILKIVMGVEFLP